MPRPASTSRALSASTGIALTTLMVTVLAFVAERVLGPATATTSSPARNVLFEDLGGLPQTDLLVVTPAGDDIFPDGRGILRLDETDGGKSYQVLEACGRRRLMTFTLALDAAGLQRVIVER